MESGASLTVLEAAAAHMGHKSVQGPGGWGPGNARGGRALPGDPQVMPCPMLPCLGSGGPKPALGLI